jgi:type IV pilus assembly protein PilO
MMTAPRDLRKTLPIATGVLAVLCVVAAGLLIFLHASATRDEEQFQGLHTQVANSRGAIVPPQVVGDRVKEAREQIGSFYEDRFPTAESAIFVELGKLASENQVHLTGANYKAQDSEMPGVQQVLIGANLNGNYEQAMKFINALERDKMFFIVDGVSLGGEDVNGAVRLNIGLETYMRSTTE